MKMNTDEKKGEGGRGLGPGVVWLGWMGSSGFRLDLGDGVLVDFGFVITTVFIFFLLLIGFFSSPLGL